MNIEDMRRRAQKRLPRMIFDYIDGGADDEISRRRNRTQFEDVSFRHNVFVNVGQVETTRKLFGHTYDLPFGIGPTGLAGLAWPQAEHILARAAADHNIPFCLSTVSSVKLEDVLPDEPHPKWFQLYIFKDRALSHDLAERAWQAGYRTLVITADCATGGNRERDPRNHFTLPLRPDLKTIFDFITRPHWLLQTALNGAPKPENMTDAAEKAAAKKTADGLVAFMSSQLDPSVTWSCVAPFITNWPGSVIVKGILSPQDATNAAELGADGVIVSNHGGRQLDGAVSPLDALPAVISSVGQDMTVMCDSGFRRGSDIIKAIALGADAVLLGRGTLYGAGAAGARGVNQVIEILKADIIRTMTLLGTQSLRDVDNDKIISAHDRPLPAINQH